LDRIYDRLNPDGGRIFFVAKGMKILDCSWNAIIIIPGVVFLKHGGQLTIIPGKKFSFRQFSSSGIGRLLANLAKVRGMGKITVRQADRVEIYIEKTDYADGNFASRCNSILENYFGFSFLMTKKSLRNMRVARPRYQAHKISSELFC
jgi:hypothetical protein